MRHFILTLGLLAFAAPPARAESIPQLDYRKTCAQTPAAGMDRKATRQSCLRDEGEAKRQLPPVWRKASAKARRDCLAETTQGGLPSNVELIVCLNSTMAAKSK